VIHGYVEDSHVMFVSIDLEVFMIPLKSLQFRNLFKIDSMTTYYPYTGFHTIGNNSYLLGGTISSLYRCCNLLGVAIFSLEIRSRA